MTTQAPNLSKVHPAQSPQVENPNEQQLLLKKIISFAAHIFKTIGPGFVKEVYHKALLHELRKQGIHVEGNKRMQVMYDSVVVGDFVADMFVAGEIMVEVRAQSKITEQDERLLINHLNVAGASCGLLLNFNTTLLESKSFFRE